MRSIRPSIPCLHVSPRCGCSLEFRSFSCLAWRSWFFALLATRAKVIVAKQARWLVATFQGHATAVHGSTCSVQSSNIQLVCFCLFAGGFKFMFSSELRSVRCGRSTALLKHMQQRLRGATAELRYKFPTSNATVSSFSNLASKGAQASC